MHVVDNPVGADPGIEQHPVAAARLGELDQSRESVLGPRHVRDFALLRERRRGSDNTEVAGAEPLGRPLVGHEDVEDIVDKRGNRQRVDRLEWDV